MLLEHIGLMAGFLLVFITVLPNNPSVLTVNRSNDWIPQRSLSEVGIDLAPVTRVNIKQRSDSVPCMSQGDG